MAPASSDALVFFGATGDLAHKKVFPALQAMVKRGHLNVPVIGVAKAGWNLDQLKARARDSLETHVGGVDGAAFDKLSSLLGYVDGDYEDPRDVRSSASGTGFRRETTSLSRNSFQFVLDRGRAARPVGLRERRTRRGREAVRSRSRFRAGAQPFAFGCVPRIRCIPHRSLSRQRTGAEPALLPLQQLALRANLEPQLRGQRPDHHGRELWSRGAWKLLRTDRCGPRRHREPPATGDGLPGHGCPVERPSRDDARREGARARSDCAALSQERRARAVPRLPRRAWRRGGFADRDLRRGAARGRQLALGGRALLHPRREMSPSDVHRGARRAQEAALLGLPREDRAVELRPLPARPRRLSADSTVIAGRPGLRRHSSACPRCCS